MCHNFLDYPLEGLLNITDTNRFWQNKYREILYQHLCDMNIAQ